MYLMTKNICSIRPKVGLEAGVLVGGSREGVTFAGSPLCLSFEFSVA